MPPIDDLLMASFYHLSLEVAVLDGLVAEQGYSGV